MKRIVTAVLTGALGTALMLAGCAGDGMGNGGDAAGNGSKTPPEEKASYLEISAEDAKARLDSESGIILLDVRTPEEYKEAHIPNAVLLPVDTIDKDAETVIPDRDAVYFVYCRSGNRSATASAQLAEMGYKNIYDLGGIKDWPYETVSGE